MAEITRMPERSIKYDMDTLQLQQQQSYYKQWKRTTRHFIRRGIAAD